MGCLIYFLLGAFFCIASSTNDFLTWDDVKNTTIRNYRKGFPPGSTLDSLLPEHPLANVGITWSKILKLNIPGLWGKWEELYNKFTGVSYTDPRELTKDQRIMVYIFIVCEAISGGLEPFCPRPCLWDSPCERIRHAVPDGCIQINSAFYATDYQCACEYGHFWDNNKRKCQMYDICPTNPCQTNREKECDVAYQGNECHCAKEKTSAGKDVYACSCNDPLESQFKWTSQIGVHSHGGMPQGAMSLEACKVKCQYLSVCPALDYRADLSKCFIFNQSFTGETFENAAMAQYSLERIKTTVPGKRPLVCLCSGGKCDRGSSAILGKDTVITAGITGDNKGDVTAGITGDNKGDVTAGITKNNPNKGDVPAGITKNNPNKEDVTAGITEDSSKDGGSKKFVIGIIVAVIAVILIGCCIVRLRKNSSQTSKTSLISEGSVILPTKKRSSSQMSQCTKGTNRNMSNSHNVDSDSKPRHDGFHTYESIYDDPHREYFTTEYNKNVRQSMSRYDDHSKANLDQQSSAVINKNCGRSIEKQMDSDNYMQGNGEMRPEQLQYDEYNKSGPMPYNDYSLAGPVTNNEYSLPPIPDKRYSLGGPVAYNNHSLGGPIPDDKYSRGGPVPHNDYSLSGPVPDERYSRGGPVPYNAYNLSGLLPNNNNIRSAQVPNNGGGPMPFDNYSKVGQVSHDHDKAGQVPYDVYHQLDPACSSHGSLADYGRIKNRVTPYGVNNMDSPNSTFGISSQHAKSEHISDESKKKQKKVRNSKKTRQGNADFAVNDYHGENEASRPPQSDVHAARHSSKSRRK